MSNKKRVGFGMVLVHILLGFLTGGLWWLFLFIRFLARNS